MEKKLTLKNFKELVDPVIVVRGLEYYGGDSVHNLKKMAHGLWKAIVQGTANYRVSIYANRSVIVSWGCNCPYDKGPVCKHVVAVLCEIADRQLIGNDNLKEIGKTNSKKKGEKRKTQKEQLVEIFKKAKKDELKRFIEKQFERDTRLRHSFLAYFADLIEEDLLPKYKRMVKNFVNAASDKYGFIDYQSSFVFADNIQSLLEKAESHLEKGNPNESIVICQAVIDRMADAIHNMDDSSGMAGSQVEQAFEILAYAFSQIDTPMMKDELFDYCLKQYPRQKYSDFEFDIRFLYLMPQLISGQEQEKQFFSLIDNAIEKEKTKIYPEWKITILLEQKINYLQLQKRESEAMQVIESNLMYSEIRKMLVDKLFKSKAYKEAKKIIHEGIELAKPTGRGKYKELARCLKEVMILPEGEKTVRETIAYVVENYKNRPAMLEILSDEFQGFLP